ncbi:hypothetical protein BDQ94DRAFT_79595 [Aspergillus welwitschiae]|uniref:Uncharacterized protein n=1 Tax=Aspergillus welwitschiae TaxID=1341132 RepID=A0A3F3PSF0_9EURO|nr:hypothetical protein BDQ94DRAFT_79595 [Aspergillus welwitschiae]RDH29871.1 hypothetical protein BDQ94DRAFT_79595 [Aspergillus welwitschiae]
MKYARIISLLYSDLLRALKGLLRNSLSYFMASYHKASHSLVANQLCHRLFLNSEPWKIKIDPGREKGMMRRLGLPAHRWPLRRTEVYRIIHVLGRCKPSSTCLCRSTKYSYMDQHEDESPPVPKQSSLIRPQNWSCHYKVDAYIS